MAKQTLLQMTQNILSAMDSDAVNSISDTIESQQVAEVIIETYYELYAGLVNPSMGQVIQLQPLSDIVRPTEMTIPENVKNIEWVKYADNYTQYVDPSYFLRSVLLQGDYAVPLQSSTINIYSDRDPRYWTTFDNKTLIFDAFNNELDASLQASKTLCWGQFDPNYVLSDNSYAPFLEGDDYPGLLAEAKSVCFSNFKQVASSKDEQRSKRQRVRRQNDEWRLNQRKPYERGPDYGRQRYGRVVKPIFGRDV